MTSPVRALRVTLVLLAGLLIAACVPTSENPIVSAAGQKDAGLIGRWHGKSKDGDAFFVHFLTKTDGPVTALLISHSPGGDDGWSAYTLTTAAVKGARYINAMWDYEDGKPPEAHEKGYHLLRYEFGQGGKTLQIFMISEDKLKTAIQDGKIKGMMVGSGDSADVRLTATSEEVTAFIASSDPKALFDKPFLALTRD